jgi:hypothetical protein
MDPKDAFGAGGWLRTAEGGLVADASEIVPGQTYTVPNTVFLNWVKLNRFRFVWWYQWFRKERTILRVQGFDVIESHGTTQAVAESQFASPHVFGIVWVSHGDKAQKGYLECSDFGLDPAALHYSLHHQLGCLKLVQCWAGVLGKQWSRFVAPGGRGWWHTGWVFFYHSWPFGWGPGKGCL